jgi:meiotically up-regulated gene 157 (Mug157) protein
MESVVQDLLMKIRDTSLKTLFLNCFMNTLDTTTYYLEDNDPSTYVITGDINAMWLRDSTLQMRPYLEFARESIEIKRLFIGLLKRQADFIRLDPYANAFYNVPKYGIHRSDLTEMKLGIHERKWELDSLCFHIDLLNRFYAIFMESQILDEDEIETISLILATLREQQRQFDHGPYYFDRVTDNPIDTLTRQGRGPDSSFTGMIHSAFRPSDDACKYPFHIPSNLFAVKVLRDLAETLRQEGISGLQTSCLDLATDIERGISQFGIIQDEFLGSIYCYEVDGLGGYSLMDDANIPNLLSLPFLGICDRDDSIYCATRKLVLSERNEYFYSGSLGSGVGSPHTPVNSVWPISLVSEAMTTDDRSEWARIFDLIILSSAGTGLLHESFDISDANSYSRPWFAWCNAYFAELILTVCKVDIDFLQNYSYPSLPAKSPLVEPNQ